MLIVRLNQSSTSMIGSAKRTGAQRSHDQGGGDQFGTQRKGREGCPSRPNSFAVRRRLHLLGGIRSSSSSIGSSARGSRSGARSSGSSVNRGARSDACTSSSSTGSVSCSSSSIGCSVGSSVRSSSSSVFSLFRRAGRESESGAGSGSSENDLAHEWYSLNSEWTTRGLYNIYTGSSGKTTLSVDFAPSNSRLLAAMQAEVARTSIQCTFSATCILCPPIVATV